MDICHKNQKQATRMEPLSRIENGNRPQACIDVTPDLCCSLIPMFSNEDIVAIRVNNACRKETVCFRISIHGSRRTSSAQFTMGSVGINRN